MTQQGEGAAANFSPESQNLKALVCFASKQEDGKKSKYFNAARSMEIKTHWLRDFDLEKGIFGSFSVYVHQDI